MKKRYFFIILITIIFLKNLTSDEKYKTHFYFEKIKDIQSCKLISLVEYLMCNSKFIPFWGDNKSDENRIDKLNKTSNEFHFEEQIPQEQGILIKPSVEVEVEDLPTEGKEKSCNIWTWVSGIKVFVAFLSLIVASCGFWFKYKDSQVILEKEAASKIYAFIPDENNYCSGVSSAGEDDKVNLCIKNNSNQAIYNLSILILPEYGEPLSSPQDKIQKISQVLPGKEIFISRNIEFDDLYNELSKYETVNPKNRISVEIKFSDENGIDWDLYYIFSPDKSKYLEFVELEKIK